MDFDIGHKFELANELNEPNCGKRAEHRPQHSDEGLGGCRGTEQRTAQRNSERYSFHYYFCPVRDLAPTRLTIIFPRPRTVQKPAPKPAPKTGPGNKSALNRRRPPDTNSEQLRRFWGRDVEKFINGLFSTALRQGSPQQR